MVASALPVDVNVVAFKLLLASEAGAEEVIGAGRGGLDHEVAAPGGSFLGLHGGGLVVATAPDRAGLQDAVAEDVRRLGVGPTRDDARVVLRLLDLARGHRADEAPGGGGRRGERARARELAEVERVALAGVADDEVSAGGCFRLRPSGLRTRLQIPVVAVELEPAARHRHAAAAGRGRGGVRGGAGHRLAELRLRVPAAAVLGRGGVRPDEAQARAEQAVGGDGGVGGEGVDEARRAPRHPRRARRPEQQRLGVQRRRRAPRRLRVGRYALGGEPDEEARHGEERGAAANADAGPGVAAPAPAPGPAGARGVRDRVGHHPPQHRRPARPAADVHNLLKPGVRGGQEERGQKRHKSVAIRRSHTTPSLVAALPPRRPKDHAVLAR